jgi:hypothetical protein
MSQKWASVQEEESAQQLRGGRCICSFLSTFLPRRNLISANEKLDFEAVGRCPAAGVPFWNAARNSSHS